MLYYTVTPAKEYSVYLIVVHMILIDLQRSASTVLPGYSSCYSFWNVFIHSYYLKDYKSPLIFKIQFKNFIIIYIPVLSTRIVKKKNRLHSFYYYFLNSLSKFGSTFYPRVYCIIISIPTTS